MFAARLRSSMQYMSLTAAEKSGIATYLLCALGLSPMRATFSSVL